MRGGFFLGAGHRGTLVAHAALMLATAASALLARFLAPAWGWPLFFGWCAVRREPTVVNATATVSRVSAETTVYL